MQEAQNATPAHDHAKRLARVLLDSERNPTRELIRERVVLAANTARQMVPDGGEIDVEALVHEFEHIFSVFVETGRALDDPTGHIPWLPDSRASVAWKFWQRYEWFLSQEQQLPAPVIRNLDVVTDQVLERLENPARSGPWDRRGLVVGSIQSGKTGNYLGLICKAIDAGYKLVIVLAGVHNSLRSQTQIRTDEGILGFDTSANRWYDMGNRRVGVGTLAFDPLRVSSLTARHDNGDFNRQVVRNVGIALGGDPYVLVVKKNSRILKNLLEWVLHVNGSEDRAGRKVVKEVPLLLIDDEADHASINTKSLPPSEDPEEYKPSAINERVRSILAAFEKSAYVGYTATPFANIFVDPDATHEELGDDIFPRSFILNLQPPSNYIGPAQIFGLDADADAGIEGKRGLPLVRVIKDQEPYFPRTYRQDHDPGGLPPSLIDAIRAFVLVCTARRARGQAAVHNSMLIHVARFVNVQHKVRDLVDQELHYVQRRIAHEAPEAPRQIRSELKELWEKDFVPTTREVDREDCLMLEWSAIEPHLHEAASRIQIREINGQTADILDYVENKGGSSVIAIGGDKLSRGLTLEGLSVSYFLRMSKMYDTLMQMGRWFGYRDGYLDLCRLYTTDELNAWYRHIALADIELRREFDYMWHGGHTPREYGLRVRTHPEGLLVTALNKSRLGQRMQLSYTGELVQTTFLYKRASHVEGNLRATELLTSSLGPSRRPRLQSRTDHRMWDNVPAKTVASYLRELTIHPRSFEADTLRLSDYIERQVEHAELGAWTIVLLSNQAAKTVWPAIGSEENIGLYLRDPRRDVQNQEEEPALYALRKSNIINPPDQAVDFDDQAFDDAAIRGVLAKRAFNGPDRQPDRELLQGSAGRLIRDVALDLSVMRWKRGEIRGKKEPEIPNGRVLRELRPENRGLMLLYPLTWHDSDMKPFANIERSIPIIGFAISFPVSDRAQPVEYLVNEVYQKLHLGDLEDADE
jgi:hypothetical protein